MASIKKISDRKFKITISNGYRPNGSKISKAKTITVPTSVHPRSVFQYVTHAAEEFEREVKQGYSEDGEMTFEQFALRWLDRHTPKQEKTPTGTALKSVSKYAISTINGYRKMLEHTYPHIGQIKLNKLRPIAIENMLLELRKRTFRGKPIKEITVQKHLVAVSAVLSDAKRNEIIARNPARMVDVPPVEKAAQIIPTDLQMKELFQALNQEPAHYKLFYLMAIFTGCRRGELCALKWSDIVAVDNTKILVVSRSRSSLPYSGVVEKGTKNNKTREIVLGKELRLMLAAYRNCKEKQAAQLGVPLSEYIFTNEKMQLIYPDTFSKRLRKLYNKIGFSKEFHLHTLRHYFVTTMLHNGVDKQTVAELAGHGDTSFLERTYCHPNMLQKHRASCAMLNGLLGGSTSVNEKGLEINRSLLQSHTQRAG
ncbi:MAG: site-specific integrase [Faecalibacterium sp.]